MYQLIRVLTTAQNVMYQLKIVLATAQRSVSTDKSSIDLQVRTYVDKTVGVLSVDESDL